MAVYIYVRQSSQKTDRSVSCEKQVENCELFAQSNNLKVDAIFKDVDVSGRLFPIQFKELAQIDFVYKSFLKETKKENQWRDGLGKLFDKLKTGDIIIVDDLSRFYRPLTNSYLESALTQFLIEKNIKLYTVKNGEVNLASFNDSLINALQNRINDNQLSIQRKKSKDSIAKLYNAGELKQGLGQMIGYKPTGRKKEVEIDEQGAKIVKYIFKSYIDGRSLLQIVRDLNKKFEMKTCVKSIKNILERPLYCGYMFDKQGQLVKSKQVEGKEIINFQTWTVAKKILDSRKTNNTKVKKYPLHFTSLLKCGHCGSKMVVCINQQGKYFSFRCMSHTIRAKNNCKVSITANTLYDKGLSLDDAIYPLLIIGLLKKLQANPKDKNVLNEKQIQLQNLITSEQKLTEMFLNGLLDASIYEQNLKAQKEKKNTLQQEIVQLEQELKEDDTEKVRLMVNKIIIRKLTYEEYQELIPYSIKDIVVFEDKIVANTVEGSVEIPRYRHQGRIKLPEYFWSNDGKNFKIYYYRNNPNIYGEKEKLFETEYMKIYYIK